MRKLFPGYYSPTEDETKQQWAEGIFIFDTSVLLNLYSYPEQAREEFLDILEGLANLTWIPYQVMLEFHRNRHKRINFANRSVLDLKVNLEKAIQTTKNGFSAIQFEKRNTGVNDIDKKIADFEASANALLAALGEACKKLNRVGPDDIIAPRLASMYDGKIGPPPSSQAELDALIEGADDRFEKKIPPGFADAREKTAVEFHGGLKYETKYGDLVVWRQILNHVRTLPESRVVLVTAERKPDFWLKDEKDKIIGPLPELISEFINETNAASFWLYSAEDFLQVARGRGGNSVSAETINEVRDISLRYEIPFSSGDLERFFDNPINGLQGFVADEVSRKMDLTAMRFISRRYPTAKPHRFNRGWVVVDSGVPIFVQPLLLDSINSSAISKAAQGMSEKHLYPQTILVLGLPTGSGFDHSEFINYQYFLRSVIATSGINEVVSCFYDENMMVSEWMETKASTE